MISEGLKLMVLGMGIVFVFLSLLFLILTFLSVIFRSSTEQAKLASEANSKRLPTPLTKVDNESDLKEDRRLVVIITAAIASHRRKVSQ